MHNTKRTTRTCFDYDSVYLPFYLCYVMQINTMALSTDYVLRIGAFDHTGRAPIDKAEGVTFGGVFLCFLHSCVNFGLQ